jgi:hypothetical protein
MLLISIVIFTSIIITALCLVKSRGNALKKLHAVLGMMQKASLDLGLYSAGNYRNGHLLVKAYSTFHKFSN